MENRFGIKDFLLFGLVTVLIVLVVAAMWQYDRQWNDITLLKKQNADLAGDTWAHRGRPGAHPPAAR